jgi:hypothetical protein
MSLIFFPTWTLYVRELWFYIKNTIYHFVIENKYVSLIKCIASITSDYNPITDEIFCVREWSENKK